MHGMPCHKLKIIHPLQNQLPINHGKKKKNIMILKFRDSRIAIFTLLTQYIRTKSNPKIVFYIIL